MGHREHGDSCVSWLTLGCFIGAASLAPDLQPQEAPVALLTLCTRVRVVFCILYSFAPEFQPLPKVMSWQLNGHIAVICLLFFPLGDLGSRELRELKCVVCTWVLMFLQLPKRQGDSHDRHGICDRGACVLL